MYNSLKKAIQSVIPKRFIIKNEVFLRSIFGVFYSGKNHECVVCNKHLKKFIVLENGDLLCPFCGSLSRNRRLWKKLNEDGNLQGNILHFSPSRSLYRNLKKKNDCNYFSTDYEDEFLADYRFDITNISQPDETFDTIICYHVLEHIIDDTKAISELYRVSKPKSTIYIQTPFKEGEIYEDDTITSPEARLQHFGQEDHVRIYSIEGLKSRLEKGGFQVETKTYEETTEDNYLGLKSPETVLILKK